MLSVFEFDGRPALTEYGLRAHELAKRFGGTTALDGVDLALPRGQVLGLLTTQYLAEADALADAIAVIDGGKVVAAGRPADLKRQVGGHTVHVRVADPADADRAAAILTAVTDREPRRATRQELTVPVTGDDDFFQIAARLRHEAVTVTELGLRLPSLDEAFLALTQAPAAATTPRRS